MYMAAAGLLRIGGWVGDRVSAVVAEPSRMADRAEVPPRRRSARSYYHRLAYRQTELPSTR